MFQLVENVVDQENSRNFTQTIYTNIKIKVMQNFKQSNQSPVGTSFHDHVVNTTVNKLTKVLGKPYMVANGCGDKVNFEWRMELADGNVFTVYDYKEYRKLDLDEIIEFHIGAKHPDVSKRAAICIEQALNGIKDSWDAVIDNYKSTVLSHWYHFEEWDMENQSLLNFLKEHYEAPVAKPVEEKPVVEDQTLYTTNVFTISYKGNEYIVRWNESYDDHLIHEFEIEDEDGCVVEDEEIVDMLIEFCTPLVKTL
jgi:hypothetical protein